MIAFGFVIRAVLGKRRRGLYDINLSIPIHYARQDSNLRPAD